MTKVLVLSDTHGDEWGLREVLRLNPGVKEIFHLGDGEDEAEKYLSYLPGKNIERVRGNGDFDPTISLSLVRRIENAVFFAAHGHYQQVKLSYDGIWAAAKSSGANAALFGHTHLPCCEYRDGILLFNPGSLRRGDYGLIEVDGDVLRPRNLKLR